MFYEEFCEAEAEVTEFDYNRSHISKRRKILARIREEYEMTGEVINFLEYDDDSNNCQQQQY